MISLTPMMQQFQAIKAEHRDMILFFRLGDFYEMFGTDAIEASKILGITLTSRNKKSDPIPMCGIPYHAAENYITRLTKAGKKVAICDQVSDPGLPGIVKRKVTRIITPGTTFSEQLLNQKANRFIAAIFPKKDYIGLAFADITTGEFQAAEFQGLETLKSELNRLHPAEIILHREHYDDPNWRSFMIDASEAHVSPCELYEDASTVLKRQLKVTTLDGFGIAGWPFAVQAAGILMRYLQDTQKTQIAHFDRIQSYHREHWMPIDDATIRNLELFSTLHDHDKEGTLIHILDQTETAFGGRMLRRWLLQPLLKTQEINARLDAVENFVIDENLRNQTQDLLTQFHDLERLLARLSTSSGSAGDLIGLSHSLKLVPEIKETLEKAKSPMLLSLTKQLLPLDELVCTINKAILEEPSLKLTEGNIIKEGFNEELDKLHGLMKDAKIALKEIEKNEIEATKISSLKVKFNKVFGYYIEVSKANSNKVPEHYHRKQTLVNAERYITPELKEHEEKVLNADEKSKTLEYELFISVRDQVLEHISEIKQNAQILASLDILLSFALVAIQHSYCKPEFTKESVLQIKEGRHPVIESITFEQSFIPNDTHFKKDETEIKLITGPNMSGKSTYLRQVALIALMAQLGSFVPAKAVRLHTFDRIFTRVGASDNLVKGQSTFMVEMQEAAFIVNHATENSLIILDEVGRGTSTYDGLSIAWAILEYLHDQIRGFTLFATHYHELIQLADQLEHSKNYSIDVQETSKGVLFLHKIKAGAIDKSYGIEVAKLAGLPSPLIERASSILHELEAEKELQAKKIPTNQMDLFARTYASSREPGKITHPALEKLNTLDINDMTPIDALNILSELKNLK